MTEIEQGAVFRKLGEVEAVTKKAVLFKDRGWVPKSQLKGLKYEGVRVYKERKVKVFIAFLPKWFIEKNPVFQKQTA